jgi:hypothetical protein
MHLTEWPGSHQRPVGRKITPAEARKALDDVQAAPIAKLPVSERWVTVPAEVGDVLPFVRCTMLLSVGRGV